MSDKPTPKIGAGHLEAFFRQGAAEVRNALYPDSNIAQRHVEPGIYGTAVPSEVAAQRQAESTPSLETKDTQAETNPHQVKQVDREPELERD